MNDTVILLINLGSPEKPETKFVKPYLHEFLMDERVIDVPQWLRTVLVKGIIVPFRASKSAAKYKSIWTKEGSPLVCHTKMQTELLQQQTSTPVYYAMRYGVPSAAAVLSQIHADHPSVYDIIVVPLYPHYAMSSYETAVEDVKDAHTKGSYHSSLTIVPPFYNHPLYIQALIESMQGYVANNFDHVLFSYHGIPERHVLKTDCTGNHCLKTPDCCSVSSAAHAVCYRHQVIETTRLVAGRLGLDEKKYSFSFQSRLGRDAWLKPFTVAQLKLFPSQGIKQLLIVCPAFVSDCLETLEEIAVEGKEIFMAAGGESFAMIPALNESEAWIGCLAAMMSETIVDA